VKTATVYLHKIINKSLKKQKTKKKSPFKTGFCTTKTMLLVEELTKYNKEVSLNGKII
jgi:hypothetical protein